MNALTYAEEILTVEYVGMVQVIVVFGGLLMIVTFLGSVAQFVGNLRHYDEYWAFNKGCPTDSYVKLRSR